MQASSTATLPIARGARRDCHAPASHLTSQKPRMLLADVALMAHLDAWWVALWQACASGRSLACPTWPHNSPQHLSLPPCFQFCGEFDPCPGIGWQCVQGNTYNVCVCPSGDCTPGTGTPSATPTPEAPTYGQADPPAEPTQGLLQSVASQAQAVNAELQSALQVRGGAWRSAQDGTRAPHLHSGGHACRTARDANKHEAEVLPPLCRTMPAWLATLRVG